MKKQIALDKRVVTMLEQITREFKKNKKKLNVGR